LNFTAVLEYLLENFNKYDIQFALMGGFAMHAAGYTRATQDIDFLVLKEDMPKVKEIMGAFGYELIHESEDASNFVGKMKELGQVDYLHAHRSYARNMLKRARECGILNNKFTVRVLTPEDIIGLKVQSSSNDPKRYHQDLADIEYLIKAQGEDLNLELVKEYFTLFQREKELEGILRKVHHVE